MWVEVSLSPLGEGFGEGAVPPPQKIFHFWSSKSLVLVHFIAIFVRPRRWVVEERLSDCLLTYRPTCLQFCS